MTRTKQEASVLARFRRRKDDEGIVMVMVIGVVFVMSLLVTTAMVSAASNQRHARRDQTWNASLAAAQAGIDDYLSRLNADGNYWIYANPASTYSGTNSPAAALPPASQANAAFTTWAQVPLASGRSQYRYEVNNSVFKTQGILKVRSTGRVGKTTRTVETTIRRRGFLDYLYFTNYETVDPARYPVGSPSLTKAEAQAQCPLHFYEGRPSGCVDINFVTGDTINGPLHTNDAFLICGSPAFNGTTTTSWTTAAPRYRTNTGCGTASPTFARAGDPAFGATLDLPPNNDNIIREVDSRYVPVPGCLYAGPTRIILNAAGTMTVTSPWTRYLPSGCQTGAAIPIPANGVVYVQTVPTDPTAANYWAPSASGKPTCPTNGNPVGYPQGSDSSVYPCQSGDVFIEGTLKGALTVAAENDIYATWDIKYNTQGTGSTDILGLVANNFVKVYHPVNCSGSCTSGTNVSFTHSGSGTSAVWTDPTIQAAMMSVQHSFMVQNYNLGGIMNNLTITGAIAQNYRGTVGTTGSPGTGYKKAYSYDTRLKYLSPPHFIDPVQSAFQVNTSAERPAAFTYTAP
jgi:Tfp pilus assembly protein PilX